MLDYLIALAPVGFILIVSEFLWRKKIVQGERARKFIHILAGIWMAFWPSYISFNAIFIFGCAALALLIFSRFTNLFHAIYAVRRKTYGELTFALAIILCAYIALAPWIFTMSILLLALADGGAAVAGRFWGKTNQYLVFGFKALHKSKAGTATFVLLSYFIMLIGWLIGGSEVLGDNLIVPLAVLPVGATVLENIGPYGIDNLLTPLFATVVLNSII